MGDVEQRARELLTAILTKLGYSGAENIASEVEWVVVGE